MTLLTICQATFSNMKEVVVDTKAPASPYKGLSWTDTSKTPPVTKVWDGSKWVDSIADAVDGIEVGGRNLILNSSFSENLDNWVEIGSPEITTKDGYKCLHFAGSLGSAQYVYQSVFNKISMDEVGQEYTISADIKLENYAAGTTNPYVALYFSGNYDNNGVSTWLGATAVSGLTINNNLAPYNNQGWVKVTGVVKFARKPTTMRIHVYTRDFTGDLYVRNYKMEKGNVATDWTPAPEDAQAEIDAANAVIQTHTEKLSTHEARISSNETEIDLRVTTSDFKSYEATVNGELASAKSRLSASESSISTLQDQITLKVEQKDIQTAVNNIQIGGRNLLLDSATKKLKAYQGSTLTFTENVVVEEWGAKDAIGVTGSCGTSNILGVLSGASCSPSVNRMSYVHSIYIKNNGTAAIAVTNNNLGGKVTIASGESKRVVMYGKGNGTAWLQLNVTSDSMAAFDFVYWHPKIEEGTKVTDWTPAPEDVDNKFASYSTTSQMNAAIEILKSSILSTVSSSYATQGSLETVQTTAEQAADKISWLVKSGTSATNFTLTDRTAELITESLVIKDKTGASTIISGGRMDINQIFAQDITATGTIRGVNLVGATGSFSGSVTATSGYIGGLEITDGYLTGVNGNGHIVIGTDFINLYTGSPNSATKFSVSADGAVLAYSIYASSSITTDGSLTAASVTLKSGGLQLPTHTGTSWVNSPTFTKCIVATPHTNNSYYPIIRQDTKSGNIFTLGGFSNDNERFGIFGCKEGCPTGTYDYGAFLDVTNGTYYLVRCNVNVTDGDVRITGGLRVVENFIADGNLDVTGRVHMTDVYTSTTTAASNMYIGSSARLARCSSSSVRYKDLESVLSAEDIEPLYDIPVHWFKYKEGYVGAEDERYRKAIPGFIVEDWESVMPIAIDHNPDGSPEMWSNNIVVPLMFEMIKNEHRCNTEVRDSLQDCDRRIYTAEAWISSAEDRIDVLQDQLAAARDEINALRVKIAEQDALIAGLGAA